MTLSPRPLLVLDTNVVLDWLLFDDPSAARLARAIGQGYVRWIATAAMRDELGVVLRRGLAAKHDVESAAVLAKWDNLVELRGEPAPEPRNQALVCADPDDQKFIDLAQDAGAHWLLSRDRAVLRLARQAATRGWSIATPERWQAPE